MIFLKYTIADVGHKNRTGDEEKEERNHDAWKRVCSQSKRNNVSDLQHTHRAAAVLTQGDFIN